MSRCSGFQLRQPDFGAGSLGHYSLAPGTEIQIYTACNLMDSQMYKCTGPPKLTALVIGLKSLLVGPYYHHYQMEGIIKKPQERKTSCVESKVVSFVLMSFCVLMYQPLLSYL